MLSTEPDTGFTLEEPTQNQAMKFKLHWLLGKSTPDPGSSVISNDKHNDKNSRGAASAD